LIDLSLTFRDRRQNKSPPTFGGLVITFISFSTYFFFAFLAAFFLGAAFFLAAFFFVAMFLEFKMVSKKTYRQ
jgi:hypothetical protein